jgi:hypothetical protein
MRSMTAYPTDRAPRAEAGLDAALPIVDDRTGRP